MSQKSREGILNELTDYFLWSFEWTYEGFYSIQNNSLGFYSLKQVFTFPKNSRRTFSSVANIWTTFFNMNQSQQTYILKEKLVETIVKKLTSPSA